jgi:hypothetical protein
MLHDDRFDAEQRAALRERRRAVSVARVDHWASLAASVTLVAVVAAGLILVSAQYRNGRVAAHEIERDHTVAIHNLFFAN